MQIFFCNPNCEVTTWTLRGVLHRNLLEATHGSTSLSRSGSRMFFWGKHIEKLKSTYLWRVASAESISKGRSREREFTIVSLMGVRGPPRRIFQVYMRFRAIWVISGALQRSFKRPTISFFYDADRWWGFGGPPSRKFEM